ncbi:MAG: aminomethyl-transferring glycine dehydrogenase subunit GcvPA [Rickettsiales bacterium]
MRYLAQTAATRTAMLDAIGAKGVEDLYRNIPPSAIYAKPFALDDHKGEIEVERIMAGYAARNRAATDGPFFLGAGCYYRHVPASVDYIIQRSEYLTAYTPYQPEIAQGTLQAVFEFQTFVAQLTGQEIANASLYDGATALAEAALMALRAQKGRRKIVVTAPLHPHYRATLESYVKNVEGATIVDGGPVDAETACAVTPFCDFYGVPQDMTSVRAACDRVGALMAIAVTDVLSLGLLPAPEEADLVCGEAQGIGLPMAFGGPHLGFFACREKYVRQMPGRLCGMTEDADGRRGFVLTLSTREQHIRREKATSNICTNQGLCALAFTAHMALLGEDGFTRLALLNHETACRLADALEVIDGVTVENATFFNEFVVKLPTNDAFALCSALAKRGIIAGYPLENGRLLVAATEMTTQRDIDAFAKAIATLVRA